MTDIIKDIKEFVNKFGWKEYYELQDDEGKLKFLEFRYNLIKEEVEELNTAMQNKDAEEVVDAIQDILVTASAMSYIADVDIGIAWEEVHKANMKKVSGIKEGRVNKHEMPDARKPDDWKAPNHENNHGTLNGVYKRNHDRILKDASEVHNVKSLKEVLKHNNKIVHEDEMLEIIGVSFVADQETIFGSVNTKYFKAEMELYNSQELNTYRINQEFGIVPKAWQKVQGDHGEINSNYGWCAFSIANGNQYTKVINELTGNPQSRRAVIIYQRPTMHDDYKSSGMNDFICTNAVSYTIRDNKLEVVVQMRSNDVIYGYKNDYHWQKHLQEKIAKELDIECGKIIWQVQNLHVYPKQRHMIK